MTVVLCPATASALRVNTGLTELRLVGCNIDDEALSHLERALHVSTTPRRLWLTGKLSGGVGLGLLVALDCDSVLHQTR